MKMPSVKSQERQTDILSRDRTTYLKGLFAVLVVLCHLQGESLKLGGVVGLTLYAMGYLSVSFFFFLSGYGLMTSYIGKRERYIREFPKKRLLLFYLNILVLIGIYTFFYALTGAKEIAAGELITSFTFGGTIISKGWYLQVILLFYILFYLSFRLLKKESHAIIMISAVLLVYVILCPLCGLSSTWYEAVWAFPLGLFFAKYKGQAERALFSHNLISFLISFSVFVLSFALSYLFSAEGLKIIAKMLSSVFFCILVVTTLKAINLKNPILGFWGKYSFEIYVMQGLALRLWHSPLIYIESKVLYVTVTTVTIIILSLVIHPLFKLIEKKIKT